MYFDQLADTEHYYYLEFEDGSVVRGVCSSADHLLILTLFYFGDLSEHDFARLVQVKKSESQLNTDDALNAVIGDLDRDPLFSFTENIEAFLSDDGIRWDVARYKIRHRDWLNQKGGRA